MLGSPYDCGGVSAPGQVLYHSHKILTHNSDTVHKTLDCTKPNL